MSIVYVDKNGIAKNKLKEILEVLRKNNPDSLKIEMTVEETLLLLIEALGV